MCSGLKFCRELWQTSWLIIHLTFTREFVCQTNWVNMVMPMGKLPLALLPPPPPEKKTQTATKYTHYSYINKLGLSLLCCGYVALWEQARQRIFHIWKWQKIKRQQLKNCCLLSWKSIIKALMDFKGTQLLIVPVSLLPNRQAFMGFSGNLLISAHHQLPATSSRGGSIFFTQKEGKGNWNSLQFCKLPFERRKKKKQAKQNQHIIIIIIIIILALHALL